MCSVYKRYFLPEIILSHSFICYKHKILNELCCHISVIRLYIYRMTIFIEHNFSLRKVKVYRTSFHSLFTKNCCKLCHFFKHRHKLLIFFNHSGILICKNLFYICVCHPAVCLYDCLCNLMIDDFTLFIYCHNA